MIRFRTKIIDEYYAANEILWFLEYAKTHIHEIGKYDGSIGIYRSCIGIRHIDSYIQKYGESNWYYNTYEHAKLAMRNTVKRIRYWKKSKGIKNENYLS